MDASSTLEVPPGTPPGAVATAGEPVPRPPRDLAIDALRGLAIIAVVLGHAIVQAGALPAAGPGRMEIHPGIWLTLATASNPLLSLVYSFHMPLFAFVSGFVLWRAVRPSIGKQLGGRVRGILVPYLAWSVVLFTVHGSRYGSVQALLQHLWAVATNTAAPGALWFLYALFVCSVLVILLARIPRIAELVLLVTAVVPLVWPLFFAPVTTQSLGAVHVVAIYPYVVMGYLAAPRKGWIHAHRAPLAICGGLAFALLAWLRYPIHVAPDAFIERIVAAVNRRGVPFAGSLRWVPTLSPVFAITALYPAYTYLRGPVRDVQVWVGRRTLGIYATHSAIQLWLFKQGVDNWVVMFAVSLAAATAVTLVIEQIPVVRAVLLGNPRKPLPVWGEASAST